MTIKDLNPKIVWKYFDEITQVPRPSKKEEKIIAFLLDFAQKHQLEAQKDDAGNILIQKAASKGYENRDKVILQSHVDMVCEKNRGKVHNFETDPIETIVEGGWLKANGTTLGADDGIGVAASLAILASDDIEHGPIEALFTVDEETGLTGAKAVQKNFLSGTILLNLDSEEEGELYIGCAGGKGTKITFHYKQEPTPQHYYWFDVEVNGLNGGHSGGDIDKGLGNANKILNRFLWSLDRKYGLALAEISGGNLHNAIAREAHAKAGVPFDKKESVIVELNHFIPVIEDELRHADPKVKISLQSAEAPSHVIDSITTKNLLNGIYACPHGVIGMSFDVPGLVETSTNLAAVKMGENNTVVINTSQRSSTESLKVDVANKINAVFTLAGAEVEHGDGYPGWKPNPNSPILQVSAKSYKRLFDVEPQIKAIHAGLECGLFLDKYPHLDMVSCGPTITGAHSPDEKIEIATVDKWWKFLLDILKNIPEKK
jgi:dipeptidase D